MNVSVSTWNHSVFSFEKIQKHWNWVQCHYYTNRIDGRLCVYGFCFLLLCVYVSHASDEHRTLTHTYQSYALLFPNTSTTWLVACFSFARFACSGAWAHEEAIFDVTTYGECRIKSVAAVYAIPLPWTALVRNVFFVASDEHLRWVYTFGCCFFFGFWKICGATC